MDVIIKNSYLVLTNRDSKLFMSSRQDAKSQRKTLESESLCERKNNFKIYNVPKKNEKVFCL